MKPSYILSALFALCMAMPSQAQILKTTVAQGDIEGELQQATAIDKSQPSVPYAMYKAIPYAEAPVGNLRWKAPVPKKPWQGVYKAEKWGDRPFQSVDPNQNGGGLNMSEDCLYLSVLTPAKTKDAKLPVFVNIHGGAFATGSYSGKQDNFVSEGIVYCSIEYRLGPLGFMAHPEAEKENAEGISGNYGIYDQVCALQWIHDNIAAFGGDPEKVTICGESAGGISVSILCASPMCKGLFRGAISESGGSFCPVGSSDSASMGVGATTKYFKNAEDMGLAYQKKLGKKNLKQMRKVSGEELIKAGGEFQFWPVVDGKAITGDIYKLYEEGNYNDVNAIVGYNSDEGSLFMHEMTLDGYNKMTSNFGAVADKLRTVYPATNDKEALYAMQDIFRDTAFGWGTWAWANLQSKTGKAPIYMYYFDQHSQNSFVKDCRGATHVAEMPFIYNWHWGPMTDAEQHMAQIMPQYWINFIKTGNPNADGLPYWTTYKQGEPTVMDMHDGFHLTTAPNQPQMDFWEGLFKFMRH